MALFSNNKNNKTNNNHNKNFWWLCDDLLDLSRAGFRLIRTIRRLFVVVWLVAEDCHCAVELLGEDEAYHLVGEGH